MPRKAQSTPEQEEKKEAVNAPADEKQEQEKGTEAPTEGTVSPEVTPEQEEKKEAVNAPADEKQEQEKGTEAPTEGTVSPEVTPEQEEKKEAVNAPADEKQEQEKGTEAPTEGTVSPEVTPEQEEKKEDKPKKVYHFTSENPYLTVSAVGVYFSDGKASTDNLAVAKYLAGLEGVELVEE